jgi:hypothetical protein
MVVVYKQQEVKIFNRSLGELRFQRHHLNTPQHIEKRRQQQQRQQQQDRFVFFCWSNIIFFRLTFFLQLDYTRMNYTPR